ncbi:hypothetical protein ONS95_008823 [Cadophora gregata]|uniref:uncharacterized protein n=1 Tax=Cadophora gregata TaxID=51156 RepID=UPI0026DB0744|nr:uncharacterized protein ONS95_008823 [Cadophora gregata]KAK0123829.1 hypothetical protein ONS95_008823 [Cadophora gregata]
MADFGSLKFVELKAELKKRGLPVHGLRKELVERLAADASRDASGEGKDHNACGDEHTQDDDSEIENEEVLESPNQAREENRRQNLRSDLVVMSETNTASKDTQSDLLLMSLAPEIFSEILSHIPSPSDLASLCLVSPKLYTCVVPLLYRKFTYHGVEHDSKILKRFWLTMLWRNDLAARVEELDIGEWGKCPRLEDHVGDPNGGWEEEESSEEDSGEEEEDVGVEVEDDEGDGQGDDEPWDSQEESIATIEEGGTDDEGISNPGDQNDHNNEEDDPSIAFEKLKEKYRKKKEKAERKALMAQPMPAYFKISKSDNEDSDFEPSESGSDSDSLASSPDSEIEVEEDGYLGPEDKNSRYKDVYEALKKEASMLGFSFTDFLADYYKAAWDPDGELDEEELLCKMLPLLKNVKTMYMMPIEVGYDGTPLGKMVAKSLREERPVLEKLEKLFMCSSLHIGTKGHREYEMELNQFLPYLLLPSLHTLSLLTPMTPFNCGNDPDPDLSPYTNKSNITSLTLDESELEPRDTFALLAAAKALTYFRWSQDSHCATSWSGCHAPFHKNIVNALAKHKASLRELDLDLRHTYCNTRGHAANPATTNEGLRKMYGLQTGLRAVERDSLLIGSLRDFSVLKTLSIDVAALCGHQSWVESPTSMVELLPPDLHTLTLRVKVKPGREVATEFDNRLWMKQVFDLLERKDKFVYGLRVLKIRVSRKVDRWDGKKWWMENEEGEKGLWRELESRCESVGIEFDVQNEEWGTKIPYFVEKSAARNPGRDW